MAKQTLAEKIELAELTIAACARNGAALRTHGDADAAADQDRIAVRYQRVLDRVLLDQAEDRWDQYANG